jgi:PAS domain-containing protein
MGEVDPLDLVETIRERLLVLDPDLTVRFANRSFADTFAVTPEDTVGRKLYELGHRIKNSLQIIVAVRTVCGLAAHARPHPRSLRESQAIRPRDISQVELGSGRAEPGKSEAINAMLPGQNLVGSQRVAITGLVQGQQATAHCRDDFRLAPDHPALRVG